MSLVTVHYHRVSVYRLLTFMFRMWCLSLFSGTGYVLSTFLGVVYSFAYFSFYFGFFPLESVALSCWECGCWQRTLLLLVFAVAGR